METSRVSLTKRGFVRLISFGAAIIAALGAYAAMYSSRAMNAEQTVQYGYMQAIEDLSLSLDNIKTTLGKSMYSNSPEMLAQLSDKLSTEAATAKTALSRLPVEELNLESTYKFLSQVGNYSKSLAEKYADGGSPSDEEKNNIMTLFGYAEDLSSKMWKVEEQIDSGEMNFARASEAANDSGAGTSPTSVTEGFTDFEEGFENYPTLIYDGPFSDHILEKEPVMLKNQTEVSAEDALKKAETVSGVSGLQQTGEENGKMPSYVFSSGDTEVSVTKQGGLFCYMVKYRAVAEKTISVEQAIEKAKEYMYSLGMGEMKNTYYEINGGVAIINFAGLEGEVVLYTDLCKVGVALDNGEIVSFDARGYITNHNSRGLGTPSVSMEEAQAKISSSLTVKSVSLCLIPSGGQNEVYCYEFSTTSSDGRRVLVYIDAETGKEEQILLLQISSGGMLTV